MIVMTSSLLFLIAFFLKKNCCCCRYCSLYHDSCSPHHALSLLTGNREELQTRTA